MKLYVYNYTTDLPEASGQLVDFVVACGGEDLSALSPWAMAAALPSGERFNLVVIAHGQKAGAHGRFACNEPLCCLQTPLVPGGTGLQMEVAPF